MVHSLGCLGGSLAKGAREKQLNTLKQKRYKKKTIKKSVRLPDLIGCQKQGTYRRSVVCRFSPELAPSRVPFPGFATGLPDHSTIVWIICIPLMDSK